MLAEPKAFSKAEAQLFITTMKNLLKKRKNTEVDKAK